MTSQITVDSALTRIFNLSNYPDRNAAPQAIAKILTAYCRYVRKNGYKPNCALYAVFHYADCIADNIPYHHACALHCAAGLFGRYTVIAEYDADHNMWVSL